MTHDSPPPEREQLRATVLRIRQLEDAMRAAGVEVPPWLPPAERDDEDMRFLLNLIKPVTPLTEGDDK